jgi:5-methylcytosine-specific restriction endonuclease McrA
MYYTKHEKITRKAVRDIGRRRKLSGVDSQMISQKNLASKNSELYLITQERKFLLYKSKEWEKLKEWAYKRFKYRCTCCGIRSGLHLDHIKPISTHPELCLDFLNVQYLCGPCNRIKSNGSTKRYSIFCKPNKDEAFMPPDEHISFLKIRWEKFFPKKKPQLRGSKISLTLATEFLTRWSFKEV